MSDINAIFTELSQIDEKLAALPADAFSERVELRERHEELRAEAGRLAAEADDGRPVEVIENELAGLRAQLAAIEGDHIDVVEQSGGGDAAGPGAEGLGATGINRQIDEARGADAIRHRIAHLTEVLRNRGVDPDA